MTGHCGKPVRANQYGTSEHFGDLIYTPDANNTLLCYFDVQQYWNVTWPSEVSCAISSKKDPTLILLFTMKTMGDRKKLLVCDATQVWDRLKYRRQVTVNPSVSHEMYASNMDAASYRRALELIRFHNISGHPGSDQMKRMFSCNTLGNCPFISHDVDLMETIMGGQCACCMMGKSVNKSLAKRKSRTTPLVKQEKRIDLVDEHKKPEVTDDEIIGCDLMFLEGDVYLVCVGYKRKFLHVIHISSKTAASVSKAISTVIDDYSRNKQAVTSVYSMPTNRIVDSDEEEPGESDQADSGISILESDGEGGIINAGINLLPKLGITHLVKPSGVHVPNVERAIRTIKERVGCTRSMLQFKVGGMKLRYLVINMANWLNQFPHTGDITSPWINHTRRRPNYSDSTRTGFGDCLVARRTRQTLATGQANGELGLSMGTHFGTYGAVHFWSFESECVKPRVRFAHCNTVNLVEMFGNNTAGVPVQRYASTVTAYRQGLLANGGATNSTTSDSTTTTNTSGGASNDIVKLEPYRDNTSVYSPVNVDKVTYEGWYGGVEGGDEDAEVYASNGITTFVGAPRQAPTQEEEGTNVHSSGGGEGSGSGSDTPIVTDGDSHVNHPSTPSGEVRLVNTPNSSAEDDGFSDGQVQFDVVDTDRRESIVPSSNLLDAFNSPEAGASASPPPPPSHSPAPAVAIEAATPPPVSQLERRINPGRARANQQYKSVSAMANRVLELETAVKDVTCATMNWKRAEKEFGSDATDSHLKEIDQIFTKYEVAKPTMVDPPSWYDSHDLFDTKLDKSLKSRLVVGKQIGSEPIDPGIDLYSPTIDFKLIYTMLSLCLQDNLDFHVWDVRGAFLKAAMATPGVFVRLRPHIARRVVSKPHWKKYLRDDGCMMMECIKAWYGTVMAPALWNKEIHHTLTVTCGYQRHPMIKCLYYRIVNNRACYITLHVDDLGACMPTNGKERKRVIDILEKKYETLKKQDGDDVTYIGLELKRDRVRNTFEVRMTKKLQEMCKAWNVSTSVECPCKNVDVFISKAPDDSKPCNVTEFRSLVMSLRYIAMTVKPEILFHCSYLSTKQSAPTSKNLEEAMELLRYCYGSSDQPIIIKPMGESPDIHVYCDASFDIHKDSKSHTGKAIFIGNAGAAVHCSSNKQHCITRSSTDAEIVALEDATFLGAYFYDVLTELGVKVGTVYYHEDNESSIILVRTGTEEYDKKRKHCIRRINMMKEYFDDVDNHASVVSCGTLEMTADAFTKPLEGVLFNRHIGNVTGRNLSGRHSST